MQRPCSPWWLPSFLAEDDHCHTNTEHHPYSVFHRPSSADSYLDPDIVCASQQSTQPLSDRSILSSTDYDHRQEAYSQEDMFFSEELLTRRKDGLGIFWLLGTLGARTRRVSKKDIVGCDLVRACETIAEPPEPMALRMSSCLLIGVARVYHQSCDHLHKDVTTFHTTLRQALVTAPVTGPGGAVAGLDLPIEKTKRVEQITIIGEVNPEFEVGLDWAFGRLEWDELGVPSKRKANAFDSDDEDDDDGFDGDDEERESGIASAAQSASKKARTAYQSSATFNERPRNTAREEDITLPRHRRHSNNLEDGSEDDRRSREFNDQYFAGEDVAEALGFDFGPQGGMSSSGPMGGFDGDFDMDPGMEDFGGGGMDDYGWNLMNFGGDEYRPSQVPYNPDAADEQAQRDLANGFGARDYNRLPTPALSDRRRESTVESGTVATPVDIFAEQGPAYDEVQPKPKKKARVPKVKTLSADEALELPADELRAFKYDYQKNMDDLRHAAKQKSGNKRGETISKHLLQGPFEWLPFIAPDMIDYYADITAPRCKPASRREAVHELGADEEEPDSGRQRLQSRDLDLDRGMDMDMDFGMDDMNDGYQEDFEDYQVPLKGGSEPPASVHSLEVEAGRRASNAISASGEKFPWDATQDTDFDNFAIPTSSAGGDRYSLPPAAEVHVRLNRRLSSLGASSIRRSTSADPEAIRRRSTSLMPSVVGTEVPFEDYDEFELPDDVTRKSTRQSSVAEKRFSQEILESLDPSCRNFLTFVNKRQYQASGEALRFDEVFPPSGVGSVKRQVACQAFYNCLSLTTKNLLNAEQTEPWGAISLAVAPDL